MSIFQAPKRGEKPDRYVGKLRHVKAGTQLSLQYHVKKDETIHLWSGEMVLVLKDGDRLVDHPMRPGDSYHVRPGTVHRMRAVTDCDVLEVSTPGIDDGGR